MKVHARRRRMSAFGVSLAMLLLLVGIDACKKDSSSITVPYTPFPSIAGHWVGTAAGGAYTYSLSGDFTQKADSFGGDWLWTITNSGPSQGYRTRCWVKGRITTTRKISLQDTSFHPENWGGGGWYLGTYQAVLAASGDSISGGWIPPEPAGGFVLIKR